MNDNVWLQLVITAGTVLGGMFVTIRYSISQANKKEKFFLDYLANMQSQQLEYYEQKNGHLERISKTFTTTLNKTINKSTRAVEKLSAQIGKNTESNK